MSEELLPYYEEELTWLRKAGAEFAREYPGAAARLVLDGKQSADPFTERLLEGVAFLAARIHRRLDDEFPEIVEGLLNVVYPHFLRQIPSAAIVQFELDPEQGLANAETVPRGKLLYTRPAAESSVQCRFRVCYDTELWPVRVASAQWLPPHEVAGLPGARDASAALRIQLKCFEGATFPILGIPRLRFYIDAEARVAHTLYELLGSRCESVLVCDPARNSPAEPAVLPPRSLTTAGWDDKESLLPWPNRSFPGYRLLQEYFSFPEKFLFFDVANLASAWSPRLAKDADLVFLFSRFDHPERQDPFAKVVNAGTFRLGCTPVVNLFEQTAEPISVDGTRHHYTVIPDLNQRDTLEIFSIDEVVATSRLTSVVRTLPELFSWRHGSDAGGTFWFASRNPGARSSPGVAYLSFVDLNGAETTPDAETITVRCLCSNGSLPSKLPFGQDEKRGDFEKEGSTIRNITTVKKPTEPLRPPAAAGRLWRLVSHLSLNYLSLVADGREALQEILRLYNISGSLFLENHISGIAAVTSEPHFARVASPHGIVFARGTRVRLELDEGLFTGGGAWLFAAVLDRFLGQYVSVNSFSQLVVTAPKRKQPLYQWEPRAGSRMVL
jgi:type VI secretion system protein ImpG